MSLSRPVASSSRPVGLDVALLPRRSGVTRLWLFIGVAILLLAALTITAATVDGDSGHDLLGLTSRVGADLGRLRWQYTALVIALGAAHYLATAIAATAAAGVPLPFRQTVLVQLSAAAANRLTPAGLGGSAVTARYFTRRGLDPPAAVGAVSALAVLGALADLLVLTALVLGGTWLGVGAGASELSLLYGHVRGMLGPLRSPWLWAVVIVGVVVVVVLWSVRARRRGTRGRWAHFWLPIGRLIRRPRALATLIAASGATTLLLGIAFVASTAMVPGTAPSGTSTALLIGFMLGAAAGSAVPVPAGLGSTEAALIAVLLSAQVPAAHAVEVVMIFRLITFWAPALVGVFAARRLHRLGAL